MRGPLDELTTDDAEFIWEAKHDKAFEDLKTVLWSNLALTHFDPNRKIVVAADASSYGKGGALMHAFPDGSLRPIMFVSSSFSPAEKNHPRIQKFIWTKI